MSRRGSRKAGVPKRALPQRKAPVAAVPPPQAAQPPVIRQRWRWPRPSEGFAVVRIVLGCLLLAAAGLKGVQLSRQPVVGSGLMGVRWVHVLEVEYEMALGMLLLSGLLRRMAWWTALTTFVLFGVWMLRRALAGYASCGCFGTLSLHPWTALTLDLLAVMLLAKFPPRPNLALDAGRRKRRLLSGLTAALIIGVAGGAAMLSYHPAVLLADGSIAGAGESVVLEPETWKGKPLPLAQYVDIGKQLMVGEWTVLLYHHDCPQCRQRIAALADGLAEMEKAKKVTARVAIIEIPPFGGEKDPPVTGADLLVRGRLEASHKWFASTPTTLTLKDGVVTSVQTPDAQQKRAPLPADTLPIANSVYNFGFVKPGSHHRVAFRVDNATGSDWTVGKWQSECPCLGVVRCPARIPAGGAGIVELAFDAPGEPAEGYSKAVMLPIAGGPQQSVALRIIANVGTPLAVSPDPLELGALILGEQRRGELTLSNHGEQAVLPMYSSPSVPACTAMIRRERIAAGGRLIVPVRLETAGKKPGAYKATLSIQTDNPAQPVVRAGVTFSISGDYCLSAGVVDLKALIPGQKTEATLDVTTTRQDAGPFVQSAELAGLDHLAGQVTVTPGEKKASLMLELTAAAEPGSVAGMLRLHLADWPRVVEIPLQGQIVDLKSP
ncbi:MAG: hypothetical protein BIFFINMI_02806 [Phycisphaerae bacterium]|nr:hypothetical protein [Phycisphaerae bacterium]